MIEFSYARVHVYVAQVHTKVKGQPVHMHYHFSTRPEKSRQKTLPQGKKNLSKVGSWEQVSNKLRNSLPRSILTYHFFWDRLAPLDILILSFCQGVKRQARTHLEMSSFSQDNSIIAETLSEEHSLVYQNLLFIVVLDFDGEESCLRLFLQIAKGEGVSSLIFHVISSEIHPLLLLG